MVGVLVSSVVYRGFEPRPNRTKDYQSTHEPVFALRSKNKDWLAQNQDNVSEWSDVFIRELLFQ